MDEGFCTRCGEPRALGSRFCGKCGFEFESRVTAPAPVEPWTPQPMAAWSAGTFSGRPPEPLERTAPLVHLADFGADFAALPDLIAGRSFLVPGGLVLATLVLAIATTGIPNAVSATVVALFLGPLPLGSIAAAGLMAPTAAYAMAAIASFLGTLGLVIYAVTVTRSVPSMADVVYAFVFYTVFGAIIGMGCGFVRRLALNLILIMRGKRSTKVDS